MFRRSDSTDLFFLQRETYSKENANCFTKYHEYGNCYNFRSVNLSVTHSRDSIG